MSVPRTYVLAGLAAYLVMLVATFPALQAYRFLPGSARRTVTLYGLEGTVWGGRAAGVRIGALDLGALRWDVGLPRLALGQVRVSWSATTEDSGAAGRGAVQFGLWGGLRLPSLILNVPASALARQLPLPVTLEGAVDMRLHDIVLRAGRLRHASGTIAWRNAAVRWSGPIQLGTLIVDLQHGTGPIRGDLHDQGGPIKVSGTVTLAGDGALQLNASVLPRPGAPKPLLQALRAGGAPDAAGRYHIRWSGRLPRL